MKILSLLFLLLFLPTSLSYPETIQFKDGRTVEANIIERANDYIKVDFEGVPLTYYLENIGRIDGQSVHAFKSTQPSYSYAKSPQAIFQDISPAIFLDAQQSCVSGLRRRGTDTGCSQKSEMPCIFAFCSWRHWCPKKPMVGELMTIRNKSDQRKVESEKQTSN